ncbi:uncharacterized protein KY384_005474 [Bacidia gigantensis]|uniref:uncharacterized protein n=1 Tax=Bacidia gigantensis TaxID=2732470 RepID=UPI001D04B767|nr:uncharacterized protein KY384_005474 [Bacidia gigantensis]KAG8529992.1 hypothetical protein KY384_005474 [Bacidia gigantensis]
MASPTITNSSATRSSQSFTRLESSGGTRTKSRASTLQNGRPPLNVTPTITNSPLEDDGISRKDDLFEKSSLISGDEGVVKDIDEVESPKEVPEGFDRLPIELMSLIDRFIESLIAKVYNTPPTADRLSSIFQDFYIKASGNVTTHISALSTQQSRNASPSASISSKSSHTRPPPRSSSRDTLNSVPDQQMLTPQEISDRRKARRLLDRKQTALEEAVERHVCERVYNRIWRHRSTLDEVRDEKLRSKTAALALVGINLQDLGVDMALDNNSSIQDAKVDDWIASARDSLLRMNDSKCPLGKLQQLTGAHKYIVNLLTRLHNSSSSADEILPTLIYTLITTPPEGINVISNLNFIQRFRASSKVDGEAAYCLTNLEAAITFLETVDLASLRADETTQGPPPKTSSKPPAETESDQSSESTHTPHSSTKISQKSSPAIPISSPERVGIEEQPLYDIPGSVASEQPYSHKRSVSNLFQPPALGFGAAGDAVRSTADQGIKGIGIALDNSFKLLFGRLSEQKIASPNPEAAGTIMVPKTLDDARKLVEPKSADEENTSEANSFAERPGLGLESRFKSEDNLLNAIAGRKQPLRDRSADSNPNSKLLQIESASASSAAVESMRNLGNSLNPLKGFGGISVMQRFGRSPSSGTPTPIMDRPMIDTQRPNSHGGVPASEIKSLPPVQRFMDAPDAKDLRMSDIPELLQDYKRLAEALRTMGAF